MYPLIYLKLVRCIHQISQSPGYENFASLNLPSIAPAKITVERIWFIKCSGISFFVIFLLPISILPWFFLTLQPKYFKISKVICVSWIFGILYNFVVPGLRIVAAIIGKEAFLEPDTGAIIFYFLSAITILFFAPIKKIWFIILGIIIILFIGLFIFLYIYNQDILINILGTSFFYRVERIITFKTESSYQLENALIAIGSSSIFGTGLNNISIYIPEAPTDFIFAFSISNFGIITGILIILCYLIIDLFLLSNFFKLKNKKIKLVLISFISIFVFQQIINIGMNLGLLPIIGIPLPFLSYGGSTIIIYFLFIAIILSLLKKNY